MGVLDCLIDNGNEPKVGIEYIYQLDMAWPIYDKDDNRSSYISNEIERFVNSQKELDSFSYKPFSIKVNRDIIVIDVTSKKDLESGRHLGYDFTIKDSEIRCHCNYPWAFFENTPENLIKIKEYKEEDKKLDIQKKKVKSLRKNIAQLTENKQ